MKEFQQHVDKTMASLNEEVLALQRWFKQDFPEATLRVHVDLDKIKRRLSIIHEVLTGQEMADNRAALKNAIRIQERDFMDPMFMGPFMLIYNEKMRQTIAQAINVHHHNEKAKLGLE